MTDEPLASGTEATEPSPDPSASATATAETGLEAPDETGSELKDKADAEKLNQTVNIIDIGPCKKHIKVSVDRGDIDKLLDEKFYKLFKEANVPGFRPGKAPIKVVKRRFHREVSNEVRGQLLMASLEQMAEEHDIAPLSAPEIDPDQIILPQDGPFVYEFDVEVRPHFDLPNYRGLKLKRPTREFTDEDVAREERRVLARWGQLVPKEQGVVAFDDFVTVDATTWFGGTALGTISEAVYRVDDRLVFKDGVAPRFAEQISGAKVGEKRDIEVTLSAAAANPDLRGRTVKMTVDIKDVKTMRLPELNDELLEALGVRSPAQLHEKTRVLLEQRLVYQQRQSAREQVLAMIASAGDWALPEDLLMRQARRHMARKVMEMKEAGLTEDEIRGRQRLLEQDILQTTALALKEHFVLQKIVEVEKLEVTDDEINLEIDRVADLDKTTARRVRARLEKEDLLEMLAAQVVERKALDLILDSAEYEDVPMDDKPTRAVTTVETQAVPGELADPTAPPVSSPEQSTEKPMMSGKGMNVQ